MPLLGFLKPKVKPVIVLIILRVCAAQNSCDPTDFDYLNALDEISKTKIKPLIISKRYKQLDKQKIFLLSTSHFFFQSNHLYLMLFNLFIYMCVQHRKASLHYYSHWGAKPLFLLSVHRVRSKSYKVSSNHSMESRSVFAWSQSTFLFWEDHNRSLLNKKTTWLINEQK